MALEANKKIIVDIHAPKATVPRHKSFSEQEEALPPEPKTILRNEQKERWKLPRRFTHVLIGTTFALVGITIITALGLWDLKNSALQSAPNIYAHFKDARVALENLETGKAKTAFQGIHEEVSAIKSRADRFGILQLSEVWSAAIPAVKHIPEAFKNATLLTESALSFSAALHELRNNGFGWLMDGEGSKFVSHLGTLQANIENIITANTNLKNQGDALGYPLDDQFLGLTLGLYKTDRFLSSAINWFSKPEEKKFLVLFQNPSEIRPAGGFIGSYAELTLTENGLKDMRVWDIYDPDGQLQTKYIPPRELQAITGSWGARDANWFFDFPTSAEKVMRFLEESKIYEEQNTTFDGVVAINVEVLKTILTVLGPIYLEEYELTISRENFLPEIQREIEAGDDNLLLGEPKRILKILTPIIFERLGNLSDIEKQSLLIGLKDHLGKKDIMLYFTDWEMKSYIKDLGLGGEIFVTPEDFTGEYLAVVNANVGGGKSDAFVTQSIKISNKIDEEGRINNYLTVERTHAGDTQKESWYRATNKNYIKIFTPKGSALEYLTGNTPRDIEPVATYSKNYLTDLDLARVEKTTLTIDDFDVERLEESGKTVFGTWFDVRRGKTETLELQYLNPKKITLGSGPIPYTFIFDKQSGVRTAIDILIEAPEGYLWKENGTRFINVIHEDPPTRVQVDLTLVPNL